MNKKNLISRRVMFSKKLVYCWFVLKSSLADFSHSLCQFFPISRKSIAPRYEKKMLEFSFPQSEKSAKKNLIKSTNHSSAAPSGRWPLKNPFTSC